MVTPAKLSVQLEGKRAKKLMAWAADAVVQGESTCIYHREVEEELDIVQSERVTPYVSVDYHKKAIKAKREKNIGRR